MAAVRRKLVEPSKPLVGILGDVDGRIVPVAPPPFSIRNGYRRQSIFPTSGDIGLPPDTVL
jgi:hypothetical protein